MRLFVPLIALLASGCAISTPYRELRAAPHATAVVSATHIRLHEGARARFQQGVDRVVESLDGQPGLVGYSLRRHLWRDEFWTYTVWADRASRDAFLAARAHRGAIANAGDTLAWERYATFEVPSAELPPRWAEVARRVEAER